MMLLNNLLCLTALFAVSFYIFKLLLRKNKLLSKTICVFLALHVILIAFILIEQHRFKTNLVDSIFMDDGEIYSSNAWQISTALTGNIPGIESVRNMRGIHLADRGWGLERYYYNYINKKIIPPPTDYHIRYVTYLYAILYAAYGFLPVMINFINVILHLFMAILIYRSVTLIFDERAAYLSGLLFLLNPISFFYSTTKMQDSMINFLVYLSIYCFLVFLKKKDYWYAFFILPIFYFIQSFGKSYYSLPLLLSFVISLVAVLFSRNKKLFFALAVLAVFCLAPKHAFVSGKVKAYVRNTLTEGMHHQRGFYNTGGQVYRIFIPGKESPDYTPLEWGKYILRGWYHMLNEPLLSTDRSPKLLLFFPVKVVFLILCILALPGILMAMRYGYTEAVIFVNILIIIGTGLAISSGNIGTMLRHRDIITPVIFIFSSFYISRFFRAPQSGGKKES